MLIEQLLMGSKTEGPVIRLAYLTLPDFTGCVYTVPFRYSLKPREHCMLSVI